MMNQFYVTRLKKFTSVKRKKKKTEEITAVKKTASQSLDNYFQKQKKEKPKIDLECRYF